MRKTRRFPNTLLVLSVFSITLGLGFLLWTSGYVSILGAFWPVVIVFLGLFLLYIVYIRKGPSRFSFPGMFLSLSGLFYLLFLRVSGGFPLRCLWPVFMCIAGISLLPQAFKRQGSRRIALFVPALAIIFLSFVFLLFSTNILNADFRHFVSVFWPVLFILIGFFLLILYVEKVYRERKGNSK